MYIRSLRIENFRNYNYAGLSFSGGTNLLYGKNAQGKTNILEAIYFCGTTKSHRTSKDSELIKNGCYEAHLRMEINRNGIDYRIDIHLRRSKSIGVAINGTTIRRACDLIGLGHFVFFSPEDLGIIKRGPVVRRRFIDMELCQLNKVYVSSLSQYGKVIIQRNHLLKYLYYHPQDIETLDVWDEQLVRYGSFIIKARELFVSKLRQVIIPIHLKLTGGTENIDIRYYKNVEIKDFAQTVKKNRERDRMLKVTQNGPHRDDLILSVNGMDIRHFGSQGQQRTAALSLKLAEISVLKKVSGDIPVLLLDDVLSELDMDRRKFLLDFIGDIQTFITCTGPDDYSNSDIGIDCIFEVSNGTVALK